MRLSLSIVFWCFVGFSAVVVALFFAKRDSSFRFKSILVFILALLGGALVFLTLSQGVGGMLRVFLIMAGTAPAAMIISVILHNAVSGLLTALLKRKIEEAVFFLIAIFGCPAALFVGVIVSITLIIRSMVMK